MFNVLTFVIVGNIISPAAGPTSSAAQDFFSSQLFGVIVGSLLTALLSFLLSLHLNRQQNQRDDRAYKRQIEREREADRRSLRDAKRDRLRKAYKVIYTYVEELWEELHQAKHPSSFQNVSSAGVDEAIIDILLEGGHDIVMTFYILQFHFDEVCVRRNNPDHHFTESLEEVKETYLEQHRELLAAIERHLKELEQ